MSTEDKSASLLRHRPQRPLAWLGSFLAFFTLVGPLFADATAEPGDPVWLRYDRLDAKTAAEHYADFPAAVVAVGDSQVIASARDELIRGVRAMVGHTLRVENKIPKEGVIVLATLPDVKKTVPSVGKLPKLADDGYWLKAMEVDGQRALLITAPNDRGLLYGVFAFLRKMALAQPLASLNERHAPANPLRLIVHWDRLDGSVDDQSPDASLFWQGGHLAEDLDRARDYARLLASVGINGLSINEPRAGGRLMTTAHRDNIIQIAEVLRPWGIRLYVAHNSTRPPATQAASWQQLITQIYDAVPDFGGLILDADWAGSFVGASSEDRAAAINTIAAALQAHGGIVLCRTCVCGPVDRGQGAMGEHDPAKVAYELFQPLDGQLADNVVLQLKHGPTNFQVREPVSPLFGALEKTNLSVEFQLTQVHLGQQRHLCFLVPMWKQVLEFDMHARYPRADSLPVNAPANDNSDAERSTVAPTPIKELVSGKTFGRPHGGFIAVSNARRSPNWFGHDLALANLYGFGRLAWDPELNAKAIAEEWTRLTFGQEPLVVSTLAEMLLKSWRTYENYTGPLGAGTLTDAAEHHYGPSIESAPSSGWMPWHNANRAGIGKDRTRTTGTGFIAQYRLPVAERFGSLEACPDELLLFMHRVPYTHVLKSGKTVIQHIYDAHYDGASEAARFVQQWEALAGKIDDQRHRAVLQRLKYQAGHAQLWRDAVTTWFLHTSGIADELGRVGNHPNRFEAEAMNREGFEPGEVVPWETASDGQCVECAGAAASCSLTMKYEGAAGWFDLKVRYFDENDGASKFKLLVAGQVVDEWTADDSLPGNRPNGHTSTRRETRRVALRPGDIIRIEATPDAAERAAIDYLEIDPAAK